MKNMVAPGGCLPSLALSLPPSSPPLPSLRLFSLPLPPVLLPLPSLHPASQRPQRPSTLPPPSCAPGPSACVEVKRRHYLRGERAAPPPWSVSIKHNRPRGVGGGAGLWIFLRAVLDLPTLELRSPRSGTNSGGSLGVQEPIPRCSHLSPEDGREFSSCFPPLYGINLRAILGRLYRAPRINESVMPTRQGVSV